MKIVNLIVFIKKVYLFIYGRLINNEYRLWYGLRVERSMRLHEQVLAAYSQMKCKRETYISAVICLYEGNIFQGGLADRLRGLLSVYKTCKDRGLDFRLRFVHPFNLELFLQPHLHDWRIAEDEINRNPRVVDIINLDATKDSSFQARKQEQYLRKHLASKEKQYHCYTNAMYSYNYNYAELFNNLFKLTPRLQAAVDKQIQEYGGNYISISCRFLDLLGDFNESFGYGKQLGADAKERLLSALLLRIEEIQKQYPNYKILVNSDSTTFLQRAKALPYVVVNPGVITHIDNMGVGEYETFEKTFLDFFMIANAVKVFLLIGPQMMKSGYPYAASLVYGKPFEIIRFKLDE